MPILGVFNKLIFINKMSLEIKIINNSTLGVYKIYKILE